MSSVSHSYKINYASIWIKISEELYSFMKERKLNPQYMDLIAYNLLFAVFFSCKQEYRYSGNQRKILKEELHRFRNNKLMLKIVRETVRGRYLNFKKSFHWKVLLWGLSVGLSLKLYEITSLAMKLLIDLKIDEHLSSVGMVSQTHQIIE
jgi:hypothetical protein